MLPALLTAGELSNRPAPPFRLVDSKGRTFSLADSQGKFLIIEFMQTTCPHCQKFAPVLESLTWRFKGRVAVISIAAHPDTPAAVTDFVETYKVTYPILLDPSHEAARAYLKPQPPNYGFSIPHVFLVDQSGYIRDDFTQTRSNLEVFTAAGFNRMIAAYVGGRAP